MFLIFSLNYYIVKDKFIKVSSKTIILYEASGHIQLFQLFHRDEWAQIPGVLSWSGEK
jgi:hypothetical protein